MNKIYKLLIIIVDHNYLAKLEKLLNKYSTSFQFLTNAKGTANNEILNYLGLGVTSKNLILLVLEETLIRDIFKMLIREMKFDIPGRGIAFTIDLSCISGIKALKYLTNDEWEGNLNE